MRNNNHAARAACTIKFIFLWRQESMIANCAKVRQRQSQKTMTWLDKWGKIIVLHVQQALIYISLTARINDRKFRKGLFSSEVLASVAVVANLVNSIIGSWIWKYCVLACRTALLERMPVFETKASEQIPNGEVPTQQEPETVTKQGTFELLRF